MRLGGRMAGRRRVGRAVRRKASSPGLAPTPPPRCVHPSVGTTLSPPFVLRPRLSPAAAPRRALKLGRPGPMQTPAADPCCLPSASLPPKHSSASVHSTRDVSSSAAAASTGAAAPERTHGGLADEDRIFTNLYRQGDPFIKVRRVARECLPRGSAAAGVESTTKKYGRRDFVGAPPPNAPPPPPHTHPLPPPTHPPTHPHRAPSPAATGTAPRTWSPRAPTGLSTK